MPQVRSAAVVTILALLLAACGAGGEQAEPRMVPQEDTRGEPSAEGTQTTLAERETPPPEDTGTPEPEARSAQAGPAEVETSVVATGLEAPWGLAFLPGGEALVTERDSSRLLRLDPSGTVEEVGTLPADGSGEGGLLGVAVSPTYDTDGLVYAYYTTAEDNRVVRFRLGEEPEPILTGIPVNTYHNGGRIEFGSDGLLYIGTGEAGDMPISQDVASLGGKILRINSDGTIPADNPFPNSPVYSYGHRNVQGLAWDEGGQLYATEFGQNTFDEVNRIEPGGNYGWPEVEGTGGEPEFIDPISTWATSEASPSGATILKDGAIPQWEGDFFMAGLRGQRLWRLDLDEEGNVAGREELLSGEAGRLRLVTQAPDGSLWVLTNNRDGRGTPGPDDDRILRLAPAEG
ncbi:MAG: PQQ-dependent sugar dehydrogenase [Actinomycetota bacterium]|nr:PQQ-dependent sugar dehydrogenase [Actinomycetota bacterium]